MVLHDVLLESSVLTVPDSSWDLWGFVHVKYEDAFLPHLAGVLYLPFLLALWLLIRHDGPVQYCPGCRRSMTSFQADAFFSFFFKNKLAQKLHNLSENKKLTEA